MKRSKFEKTVQINTVTVEWSANGLFQFYATGHRRWPSAAIVKRENVKMTIFKNWMNEFRPILGQNYPRMKLFFTIHFNSVYLFGLKQNMFIDLNIGVTIHLRRACYIKICMKHVGKYNSSCMLISYNPFKLYVHSFESVRCNGIHGKSQIARASP